MDDFGGKLRQARERRGISLRQIAATTKISVAALEALERNDTSKLPGGIFSRAFVRSYAVEVGLDPEETVHEFLERFQGEPAPVAGPSAKIPEEEIEFERRKQAAARVFIGALVLMIVASAGVVYFVLKNRPATMDLARPAQSGGTVAPPVSAPQAPVAAPTSSDPAPAAAPSTGPMRLEVRSTRPCWVSLTVDGRRVFSRTMQPGDKEAVDVRELAVVVVGDAGAFEFTVNGRPGRSLGASGEVATARISHDTLSGYLR